MNIPDDVMKAALDIVDIIREHKNCEEEYNTFQIRYREAIDIVAHALLSERESATKAERERCALIASEGSFPFDISVWLESTKKEMTAITAEAIAAAIRKGETQ